MLYELGLRFFSLAAAERCLGGSVFQPVELSRAVAVRALAAQGRGASRLSLLEVADAKPFDAATFQ